MSETGALHLTEIRTTILESASDYPPCKWASMAVFMCVYCKLSQYRIRVLKCGCRGWGGWYYVCVCVCVTTAHNCALAKFDGPAGRCASQTVNSFVCVRSSDQIPAELVRVFYSNLTGGFALCAFAGSSDYYCCFFVCVQTGRNTIRPHGPSSILVLCMPYGIFLNLYHALLV